MDLRHAYAPRISGNLRIVPFNGVSDRRVAENAEVEAVVRVLRDPLAGKDQVLAESLLQAGVELFAKANAQRIGYGRGAEKQRS